jgi:hypothetical protein
MLLPMTLGFAPRPDDIMVAQKIGWECVDGNANRNAL